MAPDLIVLDAMAERTNKSTTSRDDLAKRLVLSLENAYERLDRLVDALERGNLSVCHTALHEFARELAWLRPTKLKESSGRLARGLRQNAPELWPLVWQVIDDTVALREERWREWFQNHH
jgi:hypothetical protein